MSFIGGSLQLAWEPHGPKEVESRTLIENMSEITLWGRTHRLYSHSFLEFGGNYAKKRFVPECFSLNLCQNKKL